MNNKIAHFFNSIRSIKHKIYPYTKIKHLDELKKYDLLDYIDLSNLDLQDHLDLFVKTTSSNKALNWTEHVIWPNPDKLPKDFNPKKLLENSMSPRNMEKIKKSGIDGNGINIAIIDQPLLQENPEYRDNIKYYSHARTDTNLPVQMHGALVSCRAVGKNTGTAPGANLYYFEADINSNSENYNFFDANINALTRILEYQQKAQPSERINILSCSWGITGASDGKTFPTYEQILKQYTLIQKLYDQGIKIIHCSSAIKAPAKNKNRVDIEKDLQDQGFSKIHWCDQIFFPTDANINLSKRFFDYPETIGIPTLNMSHIDYKGRKQFQPSGGDSSAAPYLAGVYACALQDNKIFMTRQNWQEELDTILKETATPMKNGGKMINPIGIRERVTQIAREMELNLIKQKSLQNE